MTTKDKTLEVEKKLHISGDMANAISREISRNPNLYRNQQKQISEGELIRRAIDFYLSSPINQLIEKTA